MTVYELIRHIARREPETPVLVGNSRDQIRSVHVGPPVVLHLGAVALDRWITVGELLMALRGVEGDTPVLLGQTGTGVERAVYVDVPFREAIIIV